ncbi:3 5 exonuclease [Fusarium beomiforme]|uniref:3 5 exonuclease n=1 Tax=Fusarium beomiforme TaxID=44412 RepID=A0A9P5AVI2_9HYPO|nr:3 5 exonuclease [Fusarium beomiforme]
MFSWTLPTEEMSSTVPAAMSYPREAETTDPEPRAICGWIDYYKGISELINRLDAHPKSEFRLFISLFGPLVGRNHTISVMAIHDAIANYTYLIDIYSLRARVFWIVGEKWKLSKVDIGR